MMLPVTVMIFEQILFCVIIVVGLASWNGRNKDSFGKNLMSFLCRWTTSLCVHGSCFSAGIFAYALLLEEWMRLGKLLLFQVNFAFDSAHGLSNKCI